MGKTPDYYKILGVDKNANPDQIKKAFRKQARIHHPDAGGDEARFKEINEAYEVLSDEKKKALYDQYGTAQELQIPYGGGFGGQGSPFGGAAATMDWTDILNNIRNGEGVFGSGWDFDGFGSHDPFGGFTARPSKGQDAKVHLKLSFDEAFNGCEKTIKVRLPHMSEPESVTLKIPAGAVDGGRVRVRKKGHLGTNGGERGDLVVETEIAAHPYFSRDKEDVLLDLPLSYPEMVLGGKVTIPTPQGEKLRITIPELSSPGAKLTVKGKGAPKLKGSGCGNLIVQLRLDKLDQINPQVRKSLEELQASLEEQAQDGNKPRRPWDE